MTLALYPRPRAWDWNAPDLPPEFRSIARGLGGLFVPWEGQGTSVYDVRQRVNRTSWSGPSWVDTAIGRAVDFDTETDKLEMSIQTDYQLNGGNWTLVAYVYPDSYGYHSNGLGRVLQTAQWIWACNKDYPGFNTNNLLFYNGSTWAESDSNSVSISAWTLLSVRRSATSGLVTFSVDGLDVGAPSHTTPGSFTGNLGVCCPPAAVAGILAFDGKLAWSGIWQRELSPSELRTLARRPVGILERRRIIAPSQMAEMAAGAQNANANLASVTVTGKQPTGAGTGSAAAAGNLASVTVTALQPTGLPTGAATGTPNLASVTVTGEQPTGLPTGAASVAPNLASVTVNGLQPTGVLGSAPQNGDATLAQVTVSGLQPTGSGSGVASASANLASVTVNGLQPTGLGSGSVAATGNLASVTVTAWQATAAQGTQNVEATLASVTVSGQAPAGVASGSANATADLAQVTLTALGATGAGSGAATDTANLAQVTVTGFQPLVGVTSIDVYIETVCYVTRTLGVEAKVPQQLSVDAIF